MKPYRIADLEIWPVTLPQRSSFVDAMQMCRELGEGWRLPTKEEIKLLYGYWQLGLMMLSKKGSSEYINSAPPREDSFRGSSTVSLYPTFWSDDILIYEFQKKVIVENPIDKIGRRWGGVRPVRTLP